MLEYLPILVALVLAIALSFITKVNGGIYALIFAYLIGCFVYGYSPSQLIGMWPVSLCFVLFSVNLFYNFAVNNGTIDKLAMKVLYMFRRVPSLLPFGVFLVGVIISALGAGFLGSLAILDPLAYSITKRSKTNPIAAQLAAQYGAATGGSLFISSTGAAVVTLITDAGYESQALAYSLWVMLGTFLIGILFVFVAYFIFRKDYKRADMSNLEKPEPFDHKQRLTIALIVIMVAAMVLPSVLNSLFPNAVFARMSKSADIGLVCIVLTAVACLLKLGSEKEALKKVSWNILLLVSGISILVGVATDLGMVDALATMITSSSNNTVVALLITLLAGVMSVFSSTNGVVIPTLFPVVPALAAATTLPAAFLFTIIKCGSISTGNSILSSSGAISVGSAPDEETRQYCYKAFCITPFIGMAICLICVGLITVIFFH